jgi:hypothetical protein
MLELEWRTVAEFPDYEVSNYGQVRNTVARPGTFIGRLIKPRPRKLGHSAACLTQGGKSNFREIHRLVAFAFIGEPPTPKHQVAHKDGDATNNYVENLRWATRSENEMDKVEHGKSNRGIRHGMARLTEKQVLEVRSLAGKATNKEIGVQFNISSRHVRDIINRKRWSWL